MSFSYLLADSLGIDRLYPNDTKIIARMHSDTYLPTTFLNHCDNEATMSIESLWTLQNLIDTVLKTVKLSKDTLHVSG